MLGAGFLCAVSDLSDLSQPELRWPRYGLVLIRPQMRYAEKHLGAYRLRSSLPPVRSQKNYLNYGNPKDAGSLELGAGAVGDGGDRDCVLAEEAHLDVRLQFGRTAGHLIGTVVPLADGTRCGLGQFGVAT
jgi:hypothetical protein